MADFAGSNETRIVDDSGTRAIGFTIIAGQASRTMPSGGVWNVACFIWLVDGGCNSISHSEHEYENVLLVEA